MAKPFRKLEVLLGDGLYVFDRAAAETLLAQLDVSSCVCGEKVGKLREDLRKALSLETEEPAPANPFAEDEGEPAAPWDGAVRDVAAENAEADQEEKTPLCRFCEKPGTRSGERKDEAGRVIERYYVCGTAGCLAAKVRTPQPARLFAGGAA